MGLQVLIMDEVAPVTIGAAAMQGKGAAGLGLVLGVPADKTIAVSAHRTDAATG